MAVPARRADERFTYGDYVKWPEEERWELIEGVPYDMTPAPSTTHQRISGELFRQIANYLKGKPCEVFGAPFDVRLPEGKEREEDIETVVQPDILVVCDPKKLDEKGCRGAPDFVIEIVSPSTAKKDLVVKKALYEKHGVKEYWLVDPIYYHVVSIHVLGENGRYAAPSVVDTQGRVGVATLPGLEIDLDAVFASPFSGTGTEMQE